MGQSQASRKKWLMTAVKLLIVLVVLAFVWDTITKALAKLGQYQWDFDPLWLVFAGALYLLGLLPAGLFWRHVLVLLGQDVRLGEALRAYYVGHLGKYVPGKAMVVVIRAGMIRNRRVDTGVAAASVFFETLTMMAVGAFLAAAILAAAFRGQTLLFSVAVGLMVLAGMPTLPPVFKRLVRLVGVGKTESTDAGPLGQLHLCTAGVSLAMVAGFLSLVPGGAVVREAILAELMVPWVGEVLALVSAVMLRLVWLLSELAISGILYAVGLRPAKRPPPDHPADKRGP